MLVLLPPGRRVTLRLIVCVLMGFSVAFLVWVATLFSGAAFWCSGDVKVVDAERLLEGVPAEEPQEVKVRVENGSSRSVVVVGAEPP
jgi:hypothetical protein